MLTFIFVLLFQGCTSLHNISTRSPGLAVGDKLVVELYDGKKLRGEFVSINQSTIEIASQSEPVQGIDLKDVKSLSVRRYSNGKTMLLVLFIAAAAAGASYSEPAFNLGEIGPSLVGIGM